MITIFKNKKKISPNGERTINLISEGLKANGLPVKILSMEDVEFFLEKGKSKAVIGEKSILDCKMIYFRKTGNHRNIAFMISNMAKTEGIPFLDRFYPKTSVRGKLIQMFMLATNNLSIPKTYHSPTFDEKKIGNAIAFLKLPIVVKATNFGGGRMVYLAKNRNEIKKILKNHPDTEFILQEFIRNTFDYRIVVLGGKASAAEKRIRMDKKEFRNNACVGGKEVFLDVKNVPKKINSLAVQAAKIMDVQVAGVDVVRSITGKDYVFEVNPAPGFSIDDKTSNELSEIIKYLTKCAKKTL